MEPYSQELREKISASLDYIDRMNLLGNSQHQLNLLNYLIFEELEGRGEDVTAYNIGVEVLGKEKDFDPNRNTSVRVEMLRLRRSLSIYNSALPPECVVITIPKRTYRPVFEDQSPNAHMAPPIIDSENKKLEGANIAPIADQATDNRFLAKRDIIFIGAGVIALFALVLVFGSSFFGSNWNVISHVDECSIERPLLHINSSPKSGNGDERSEYLQALLEFEVGKTIQSYPLVVMVSAFPDCAEIPSYHLKIQLKQRGGSHVVTANIYQKNGENAIWTKEYIVPQNDDQNMGGIAYVISYDLAAFDRFLPQHAARVNWASSSLKTKYLCILESYQAFAKWPYSYRRDGAHCLLDYTETESHYADIPALYAIYLHYIKMGLVSGTVQNIEEDYQNMLRKSRLMNGTDPVYLYAYLLAKSQDSGEGYHEMSRTIDWIHRLHGNNPVAVAQASLAYGGFMGHWSSRDDLLHDISPFFVRIDEMNSYHIQQLLVNRNFEEAFTQTRRIREDKSALLDIYKLAIYGQLQNDALIRSKRQELASKGFYNFEQIQEVIVKMHYHHSLSQPLLEGLEKAYMDGR